MKLNLSEEHLMIQKSARDFAQQELLHEYLGSKFELIFILSKVSILIRICKK